MRVLSLPQSITGVGCDPPLLLPGTGGVEGAPARLCPGVAASLSVNGGRAPFSLGRAASSSLLNHV